MSAPLAFPHTPIVELYAGGWQDVSADVRQDPATVLTRGRKDYAARTTPGKLTFALDDTDDHGAGDYDPNNPMGQWFDDLGRNAPVRLCLPYGVDTFDGRTVASGWGTSATMGAWSTFNSAGTMASDVGTGSARHSITATGAFLAHYLPSVSLRNVDVYIQGYAAGGAAVTGGELEVANLLLRGQSTLTYYMLRVTITTAGLLQARLMVGSSQTLAGPVTVGAYNGTPVRVRFQADGNTFRGKVWHGTVEPLGWAIEYSHGSVFGAGWVGVRSGVAGGNSNGKPIVFAYDDFRVRLPRWSGEVAKMVPASSVEHSNRYTAVECGGIIRRLQRSTKPLDTALHHFLTTGAVTLVDYWPLDETPESAVLGRNVVAGGMPAAFARDITNPLIPTGAIKWGAAIGLPSLGSALELTNAASLSLPIRGAGLTAQWSVSWLQKLSADNGGSTWIRSTNANGDHDISFVWYTDGSYEVYRETGGGAPVLLLSGSFGSVGFDDVWHAVAFSAEDNGAGATYTLAINGTITGTSNSPVTFVGIRAFEVKAEFGATVPSTWAQVAVMGESLQDLVPDPLGTTSTLGFLLNDAARGWVGEPAGVRFARLCGQQGVPWAMVGYAVTTPPMGPQRPLTLLVLAQECVDVDKGSLYEPAGSVGLGMRTHRATVAPPTLLTLDYSDEEVAPPFGASPDDQGTVNDVTAKRPNGGEYRREQLVGPLNVNDPGSTPGAVGRYDIAPPVNTATDAGLIDAAAWRVHAGTVDEPRYPEVTVDLYALLDTPALLADILDLDVDDMLVVTNADVRRIYDDVRQLARGFTETISDQRKHTIRFNTTPASPYDAGSLDSPLARLGAAPGVTWANTPGFLSGTSTVLSVVSTGGTLWTTKAGAFPFQVRVSGVVLNVTNITGASSPQTFTVDAAPVNGVVKTIPVNAGIQLVRPIALA